MADLSKVSADSLNTYKQVWAFSTDEMNARDQQTLIDFMRDGGNLVIFPYLPDREMSQKPCTLLRDAISIEPAGSESIDSPLIDIFNLKDIKCANPQIIYAEETLGDAEVIGRTIRGNVCGFMKTIGEGSVLHLGTWIGFDTEGHIPVYETMLKRSGAKLSQASSSNNNITVRERFASNDSALLFIGNYYNEEQKGKVTYTHPGSGEDISIPFSADEMLWPALYGVLSPVCLEISGGLQILHSTSDILGIVAKYGQIEITLFGDRDLAGEIVFEGENVAQINSITIDDKPAKMLSSGKRIVVNYPHKHKKEIILRMKLNS
jgi:beta-galactosidase